MLPILAIISLAIGQVERPPKLDFKEKIDYAAWINSQMAKGKRENAMSVYVGLLPKRNAKGELSGGIPAMEGAAKEQLTAYKGVWTKSGYPALAAYIEENGEYIKVLKNATKIRDCWEEIEPGSLLIGQLLPLLGCVRSSSRALIADAWMKQPNQAKSLDEAHRVVLRASRHMNQQPFLLGTLVGLSLRVEVYGSIRWALDAEFIKEKECAEWYASTLAEDPGNPPWETLSNFEAAMCLDAVQYVCPKGKHDAKAWKEADKLIASENPLTEKSLLIIKQSRPEEAVDMLWSLFEERVSIGKGPLRWSTAEQIGALKENIMEKSKKSRNLIALYFLADLKRCYQLLVRAEAERRGTMLTLAIHAHHAKHGIWPKDLGKIDAGVELGKIKAFRVDPFTGKRFAYRVDAGQPILYSLGADGVDDNGKHHPKYGENGEGGDYVFWPPPRE